MTKRSLFGTLTAAALAAAFAAPGASADTIRVQSTSDTVDAGLVEGLLRPAYKAAQPQDDLDYVAVGTGKALDNARSGIADLVITHAPSLEKRFVQDGFSLEPAGRAIFYSDYVLVGPRSDPAGVLTDAPHDAISALERIAAAGDLGRATFVSRGDNSGTNVQEQLMWGMTGDGVVKQQAANGGTDTSRREPGTGGTYPAWYGKTNKTQAASLEEAALCPPRYVNGSCYSMVDRGTFNRLLNAGTLTTLSIVSQHNTAEARGGKDLLINPFSVYIVNPAKWPATNVAAARRFVDFLVSPAFQTAIDAFPNAIDPAFRADAYPSVTLTSGLPATAASGAAVPLAITLANKQPGAPAISGMPVQLQQSIDDGRVWSDVGTPQATDAAGRVAFAPVISTTTRYRLSLGLFQATDWNQLSPNTQDLGTVSVPPTPRPVPISTPRARDRTAPKVSKPKLGARALLLTVNERSTVKATVRKRTLKRVGRGRRARTVVRWVKVRSGSTRAARAGRVRLSWTRPLPAGAYRVVVTTRDAAGNARTQTLGVKIPAKKKAVRR